MLILTRKQNQRIFIDNGRVVITVVEIDGYRVRLGFEAAHDCDVDREEIFRAKQLDRQQGQGPSD